MHTMDYQGKGELVFTRSTFKMCLEVWNAVAARCAQDFKSNVGVHARHALGLLGRSIASLW